METNEMIEVIKRAAPWAKNMTAQEIEFVVRRALSLGLDPLNPSEVQIWKDDSGRVNFQIGYTLLEAWVKKTYGQHTQPRYTRLSAEELKAEGLPETAIAYRCEFIMNSDLKTMAELAAVVGTEEALRMFTCIGVGVATANEYNGSYFAPKGRSPAWKVQKRALTDAYRRKFGQPTATELTLIKQKFGYAITEEDEPAPALTAAQANALLYDAPAPALPVPAPASTPTDVGVGAVTVETEIEAETEGEPAPAPAPAPPTTPQAHWIDDPQTRTAFWARAYERGLTQQDVLAALGVERVHDFPGTLAEAWEAIKRYIAAKGG